MVIVKRVVDVAPLLPVAHQPLRAQEPEVVRARCLGETGRVGEVTDAELVGLEQGGDQTKPTGIGQQPERLGEIERRRFRQGGLNLFEPLRRDPVRLADLELDSS